MSWPLLALSLSRVHIVHSFVTYAENRLKPYDPVGNIYY